MGGDCGDGGDGARREGGEGWYLGCGVGFFGGLVVGLVVRCVGWVDGWIELWMDWMDGERMRLHPVAGWVGMVAMVGRGGRSACIEPEPEPGKNQKFHDEGKERLGKEEFFLLDLD